MTTDADLIKQFKQHAVWEIWEHCRENRNSLESERHCKIVAGVVNAAVKEIAIRNKELRTEITSLKRLRTSLRKQVREQALEINSMRMSRTRWSENFQPKTKGKQ